MWAGDQPGEEVWLGEGLAIEGDFAGIQSYVLKPVPGAKGAAKRLRARSFRVAEETQKIAESICREFGTTKPFYVAGGRFLVCAAPTPGWPDKVSAIQARIDRDFFAKFGGEVAFHLAAAPFKGQQIPRDALLEQHRRRRSTPLAHALHTNNSWNESAFFAPAGAGWGKCPACLRTMSHFQPSEDQQICQDCADDVQRGTELSQWRFKPGAEPRIRRDEVVHYFPKAGGKPASFEDLVTQSAGKQWLGHLRIDADHIGASFRSLEGSPSRIWGLSRFLHTFFCRRVQELIEGTYPSIYPVYGGGDDLYVIGPWDKVLDFAVKLNREFQSQTAGKLTFSAGFALAKPHQHILTKSDEAADALETAKEAGRNRICALGTSTEWDEFHKILLKAGDVLRWYRGGMIPAALSLPPDSGLRSDAAPANSRPLASARLQDILQLSQAKGDVARGLWQPLLHYQISRNVKWPDRYCTEWLDGLQAGGEQWRRAPLVIRYALLAAAEKDKGPKE